MSEENVIIVFRSRVDEDSRAAYEAMGARMAEMAAKQPGYLGIKTFIAEDGERVSIAEFESLEAAMAWRAVPEHQDAQAAGRTTFYTEYELITCKALRRRRFKRGEDT